jgi:hypothetical protein
MPRHKLTPEERKANQKAAKQRYKANHPERAKASDTAAHKRWRAKHAERETAKAHERYIAKRDAMTPEELTEFRQRHNQSRKNYVERHRDEVNSKAREHWAKPEIRARELARQHARWESNPKFWHAYAREARVRNLDTHKTAQKRWSKNNRHKTALYVQKRRARIRNAPRNDVTPEQRMLVLDSAHGRCVYCPHYNPGCRQCAKGTHADLEVDHISPVGPEGPNTLHNLVACCRSCNPTKGRKPNPIPVQPLLL